MNCEYSKVAIINKQTNLLEHYSEDGEKVEHDWRFGIMGECLKT